MASKRFLIAPYNSGLQKDLKPWLIPEEAFELINNAYVWRGRVKKRLGSSYLFGSTAQVHPQLFSRFRVLIDTTDINGDAAGTVPGVKFRQGQMFSIGDQLFTVQTTGTPVVMLNNTGVGGGTFNTTTGAYAFVGTDGLTDIYYYPADPVMGFAILDTTLSVNFERYIGFDTQFSYEYQSTGGWQRLELGASTWTSDDAHFFYSSMYRGATDNDFALFTTNNTPSGTGDGIRYFIASTNTWTQLTQSYSASANTGILGARIVIQFKGRLLLFSTFEQPGSATTVLYQNRVRWSQIGNPTQTDAWYDQTGGVYGKGGALDAPTQQAIITVQILRDRMIVYFERSTWEMVYTNNEILPFRWQNINIELGSESTFSLIPFDKGLLGIAEVGIHSCNGLNVERIDGKIPDQVFEISNNNSGPERVQGIRDFNSELAYWAMPNIDTYNTNLIYPNQLLVYNYRNDSWATWDDSVTAFGYINLNNPITWSSLTSIVWDEWITTWESGNNQSRVLRVLAGNQEGYTFYIDRESSRNASVLQITNIALGGFITITAMNHNVTPQMWVYISNCEGTGDIELLNDQIYAVISTTQHTFTIVNEEVTSGIYDGGGVIATVSQIDMLTKQYNFYIDIGVNFAIDKIDMLVGRTDKGQVTVLTYPSTGNFETNELILETSPYTDPIYNYEQYQDLLWHPVYPNITGSYIQFRIQWDGEQMLNEDISLDDFSLHAMLFYTSITSSRLQ